ncbi:ECF transporter S component [Paenibacillus sp. GCM10028914]|uniref:ECF transporter S component n=1 Tax=Paenibacillus sp. GCM10028914 TaxID=3273416 RepID=UPI003612C50B
MESSIQGKVKRPVSKGLRLSDILVTVLVSLVLGVVYHFWGSVYNLFKPLFFEADELLYGMWFAAATLAFLLIRKPGVALIAELAAAHVEVLFGSGWGLNLLLYGIIQGLGAELVFAAFRYRKYTVSIVALAGAMSAVGSMLMDFYLAYTDDYAWWLFVAKYSMRVLSGAVIAGFLMFALAKALERTGVTSLLRPASAKDYEALDDPKHV